MMGDLTLAGNGDHRALQFSGLDVVALQKSVEPRQAV